MRPVLLFAWLVAVSFLMLSTTEAADPLRETVHVRNGLANARIAFENRPQACVAFIGGSITEMNGYRPMVCAELERRFPDTKFKFVNAGISSTCSTTGAFRLQRDVLVHKPDLLLIEFAVNDDQDAGHSSRECLRGMEGIVRQARLADPRIDMLITQFVNPPMLEKLLAGETPVSSGQHEIVAEHYGISSCDVARELANRIAAGSFTWEQYGGTHPQPAGNRLAADLIVQLMETSWREPLADDAQPTAYSIPAPMDENSYFRGRFLAPNTATLDASWQFDRPDWSQLSGQFRDTFAEELFLHTNTVDAELSLPFSGTAIGAYVLAGPDAGSVEISIDGGESKVIDLFHHFSKGLHYPRTVMFATDLPPGDHRLALKVSGQQAPNSTGHAVRIMQFVAN